MRSKSYSVLGVLSLLLVVGGCSDSDGNGGDAGTDVGTDSGVSVDSYTLTGLSIPFGTDSADNIILDPIVGLNMDDRNSDVSADGPNVCGDADVDYTGGTFEASGIDNATAILLGELEPTIRLLAGATWSINGAIGDSVTDGSLAVQVDVIGYDAALTTAQDVTVDIIVNGTTEASGLAGSVDANGVLSVSSPLVLPLVLNLGFDQDNQPIIASLSLSLEPAALRLNLATGYAELGGIIAYDDGTANSLKSQIRGLIIQFTGDSTLADTLERPLDEQFGGIADIGPVVTLPADATATPPLEAVDICSSLTLGVVMNFDTP